MSQYTISIKSIINIKSHVAPYNDDVFADTAKKIQRGREIFFNFDYEGDELFKRLFEEKFIIKNLTENICYNDVDLFILALKNDVETKAPIYYKRYKAISELRESDLSLGDETTHTSTREGSESRTDSANSETNSNTTANGKTKSSQFPQDIANADDFGAIRYMDGGNASEDKSTGKSTNKSSSNGSGQHRETLTDKTTRKISPLDRMQTHLNLQADIITDFVNSFNDLFIQIW